MHGETDAFHMLDMHTKLVLRKEIGWTELKSMLPFEKEAFINILLKELADVKNVPPPTQNDIDGFQQQKQPQHEMSDEDMEMMSKLFGN